MRRLVIGVVSLVGAGCVEPGESPLAWAVFDPGQACEVERDVLGPYCVSCHDGAVEPLDLRGPALASLTNRIGEYGKVLVVPGDPEASFLYRKCTGPGADEGEPMPEGRALPDSALAALHKWIADGAPACTSTATDAIIVGGPVAFGGPPADFVAEQPSWAGEGTCSSEQWWRHPGLFASGNMHPGQDCLGCHARAGGPGFSFAGTVYPTLHDPDDCRGVPGVKVEILDPQGQAIAAVTSNEAGNFALRTSYVPSFRARLTYEGRTREMALPVTGGSCNACHGPIGGEGAPGRIVAP